MYIFAHTLIQINMKSLYDKLSKSIAKQVTKTYSTSFSLGIKFLHKDLQNDIYSLYGYVRLADEIVDSFHGFEQEEMLNDLKKQTYLAIEEQISLNPILNAFQHTVNKNSIPIELINQFLHSMEMDLDPDKIYNTSLYDEYIVGSAEVVGLMCLKIFLEGDEDNYNRLEPYARALGSAFQKINFLRDFKADYEMLGRVYFPGVDFRAFSDVEKKRIEKDIAQDFKTAYKGILKLPKKARFGVYIAYVYYFGLFKKIKGLSASELLKQRVRINDGKKYTLMVSSYLRHSFNLL